MNGKSVRLPSARGGSSRARTLPKWQSVPSFDHSCPTERSESRIDGTHRTSVRVYSRSRLWESLTVSGKSPTATQGRDHVHQDGCGMCIRCRQRSLCVCPEYVGRARANRFVCPHASRSTRADWRSCADQHAALHFGCAHRATLVCSRQVSSAGHQGCDQQFDVYRCKVSSRARG
eukprot:6213238-Pleurochrysis_carterae.AAC.6